MNVLTQNSAVFTAGSSEALVGVVVAALTAYTITISGSLLWPLADSAQYITGDWFDGGDVPVDEFQDILHRQIGSLPPCTTVTKVICVEAWVGVSLDSDWSSRLVYDFPGGESLFTGQIFGHWFQYFI